MFLLEKTIHLEIRNASIVKKLFLGLKSMHTSKTTLQSAKLTFHSSKMARSANFVMNIAAIFMKDCPELT